MPWDLGEGEHESGVQRDVRHVIELGLALAPAD